MSPKDTVLARRARFVAAAVAAIAGCSEGPSDPGPTVCLTPVADTGVGDSTADASVDTGPVPCLSDVGPPDTGTTGDTGPTVCLSAPLDTGLLDTGLLDADSASDTATDAADTGPVPCLVPPPS